MHSELAENLNTLQQNNESAIFARIAAASIRSLEVSLKAVKGVEDDRFSREGQLKAFCAVIGGFLGLLGGVGGPVGLFLGVAAGITVGILVGKAIARLSASPEEKLANQCDAYRNPSISKIMDGYGLSFGAGRGCSFFSRRMARRAEREAEVAVPAVQPAC